MSKEIIIKKVCKAKGGSGGEYGILRVPRRYIGKIMFMRLALKKEVKKIGMTNKFSYFKDYEGSLKRSKERDKKLKEHIKELNKIRKETSP